MKYLVVLTVLLAPVVADAQNKALDDRVANIAKMQSQDAAQTGTLLRGRAGKNDFQVLLEESKCYWFVGASVGLDKFYMYLWSPGAGTFTPRVADAKSKTDEVTLAYCTKEAGLYKFQVKAEGAGEFSVGVFAKDGPKVKPVEAVDIGAICTRTAAAGAAGAQRVGDFFAGAGSSFGHDDRVDYTVLLEAGKCYWMIGCADPKQVKSLYLFLWDAQGKRITEAKSDTPNPMVGHCAKETAMYKLQAKMNDGNGAFKVGLYRQ